MTGEPTRRGGWPGPRKRPWSFRVTDQAAAAVARYIGRRGWNEHRDRSRAINAMLATHPDAQEDT